MSSLVANRYRNTDIFNNENQGIDELILAVWVDDDTRLQQLLDAGVPVDGRDEYDLNALMYASAYGSNKCLQILINNGADVNAKGSSSYTGLHWAVQEGHIECARMLIANGARINERDGVSNKTPLIVAAACGDEKRVNCVRLLLDNNADVFAKDKYHKTALDYAKEKGKTEIVNMLEEHIAALDPKTKSKQSNPRPTSSNVIEMNGNETKMKPNQKRCTRCSCKECVHEKNEMQNQQRESEGKMQDLERKIHELEKEMQSVQVQSQTEDVNVFVTTSKTSAMYGADFLSQDALKIFSRDNQTKFMENVKLAPVLTHLYTKGVITAKQLQRIESERTDIDRAEHAWNLMTTKQRYLDGVRDALKGTGQKQLADILE